MVHQREKDSEHRILNEEVNFSRCLRHCLAKKRNIVMKMTDVRLLTVTFVVRPVFVRLV